MNNKPFEPFSSLSEHPYFHLAFALRHQERFVDRSTLPLGVTLVEHQSATLYYRSASSELEASPRSWREFLDRVKNSGSSSNNDHTISARGSTKMVDILWATSRLRAQYGGVIWRTV